MVICQDSENLILLYLEKLKAEYIRDSLKNDEIFYRSILSYIHTLNEIEILKNIYFRFNIYLTAFLSLQKINSIHKDNSWDEITPSFMYFYHKKIKCIKISF